MRAQLAKELQRLRDLAGLSGRELARRTGISQPKVSRIEHGQALTSLPEAERWLTECGASPDVHRRVLALVEAVLGETRPWGELLQGRDHLQDLVRERDTAAALVQNFQPTVIPGLLQTAEYARRILALGRTDVAFALAARLDRQQMLHEPGRQFEFLIVEHVLTWSPGPEPATVLGPQLDRLMSLATLENIEIAVLPRTAVPVLPWHNFVIRQPADRGPAYVTTELVHGAQEITDPASVAVYRSTWARLWDAAVVGREAMELIRTLSRGTGR
jgi:transcriptional regulator with XRE-family HTH domain